MNGFKTESRGPEACHHRNKPRWYGTSALETGRFQAGHRSCESSSHFPMIQLDGLHPDRSKLEEVRGHAPAPIRSMNLQIALRGTTAGVALVSRPRPGHGCLPAAAAPGSPGGAGQAHSEVENGRLLLLRRQLVVSLRQRLKTAELVPHSQSG